MTAGFDPEPGEVFDDAWTEDDEVKRYRGKYLPDGWNAAAEVEGIRRALNYRQCYISRMPQEDTGAFWKATIYSPRDPKMGAKLELSTKQGLDAKQYGGFSSQQFAYFFIYEAKKKGKPVFRFSQVPVWLAARIEGDSAALGGYARGLAEKEGLEYVGITRSKIYKKQLIEVDGDRLIITGAKEVRSGSQLAFSQDEMSALLFADEMPASDAIVELNSIWLGIDQSLLTLNKRLSMQLNLSRFDEAYANLSADQRKKLLTGLIALVNGNDRIVDLSMVGGPSKAGHMSIVFSKLLNDPQVTFFIVDQSVTGMFERRTRVGL